MILGINTIYARLTTVFITLGSTIFLYLISRYFSGAKIALLSVFFFATIPYNVFYSSAILPGPLMVFGVLALFYFFIRWLNEDRLLWGILSIVCANLAILTWPIAIFFFLPLLLLAFNKYGFGAILKMRFWIFALFSIIPFITWRLWMIKFPEGIPNWHFLLNEGSIRYKGAFFRWMIAERIGKLILTVGGFVLFIFGLLTKKTKVEILFYFSWLISTVLFFIVFASGNVRHDYYQISFIPIAAIFMAFGFKFLFFLPSKYFFKTIGPPIAISLLLTFYAFGIFEVRGFYWINKPQIVEAGEAADRLLPKDATVVAPYGGDAAFLYQTNRPGYPIVDRPLEKFIEGGTKYLVSVDVNDTDIQNLARNC